MKKLLTIIGLAAATLAGAQAQIVINALNVANVTNFDSMGASATAAVPAGYRVTAAGDTIVDWADVTNVTATLQQASSGTPTTGSRYNWGQTASDRSLGFMTSGSYDNPNSIMGAFTNSTGSLITGLNLAFDYERFRINTAAASVAFFTSINGSTWTARTAGDSGAFSTGTNAYNFAAGTVVNRSFSVTGLSIANASTFYLRWAFDTTGANSQGIGLDNVSVTAVPEPSTWALIGLGSAFAIWNIRRRRAING